MLLINKKAIQQNEYVKYLGILIDSRLTFIKYHIAWPEYQGHFVVVCGFNRSTGCIFYNNPAYSDREYHIIRGSVVRNTRTR